MKIGVLPSALVLGPTEPRWTVFQSLWLCSSVQSGRDSHLRHKLWEHHAWKTSGELSQALPQRGCVAVARLIWFLWEKRSSGWNRELELQVPSQCPGCVSCVQATPGYRGWAQWHPVGRGAFWGPRLAGLHLHAADGDDAQEERGEAAVQDHRARSAGRDICGEVKAPVIWWPRTGRFALMWFWRLYKNTENSEWRQSWRRHSKHRAT